MPVKKFPLTTLQEYLPEGAVSYVIHSVQFYKIHLTITRERKTVLGNYRHKTSTSGHKITVNGNLNKYSFFITFLHELAHLVTYEQFGNKVLPHGDEWKKIYSAILTSQLQQAIFPADIKLQLQKTVINPGASCQADAGLMRVLQQYDEENTGVKRVEELLPGTLFETEGKIFKVIKKRRTRIECEEAATQKKYLFSAIYRVMPLPLF